MAKKKTLLDKWRAKAYDEQADKASLQKLWIDYFQKEKNGCINWIRTRRSIKFLLETLKRLTQ